MFEKFDISNLENSKELLEQKLTNAKVEINKLLEIKNKSYENFVKPYQEIGEGINQFLTPIFHIDSVKNSEITKKAYEDCLPLISIYETELSQDVNIYSTLKNKIYPKKNNEYVNLRMEFTKDDLNFINSVTKGLTFDQTFKKAQEFAFNKEYTKAQLLCNYVLNEFPNHADARTLKGRTLAWEGNYKEAELELLNVLKRVPYYYDSYLALMDVYWWSNQDEKSIKIAQKAYKNKIVNGNLGFKLAKAFERLNNKDKSIKIMDSLLKIYPNNTTYKAYKQTLK